MTDPAISSLDQLDTLLNEAKITREDYETLRAAIEAKSRSEVRDRPKAARLMKSRVGRQLGGVCAGLARRLGVEPWRVRVAVLLALEIPFLMGPLWISAALVFAFLIAFTLPMAYAILYCLMPWDTPPLPKSAAAPVERSGGFAGGVALLWLAFLSLETILVPRWETVLAGMGVALTLPTRLAFAINHFFVYFGFYILWQLGVLVGVHMTLAEWPRARRIFGRVVLFGLTAFFLFDFIVVVLGFILQLR